MNSCPRPRPRASTIAEECSHPISQAISLQLLRTILLLEFLTTQKSFGPAGRCHLLVHRNSIGLLVTPILSCLSPQTYLLAIPARKREAPPVKIRHGSGASSAPFASKEYRPQSHTLCTKDRLMYLCQIQVAITHRLSWTLMNPFESSSLLAHRYRLQDQSGVNNLFLKTNRGALIDKTAVSLSSLRQIFILETLPKMPMSDQNVAQQPTIQCEETNHTQESLKRLMMLSILLLVTVQFNLGTKAGCELIRQKRRNGETKALAFSKARRMQRTCRISVTNTITQIPGHFLSSTFHRDQLPSLCRTTLIGNPVLTPYPARSIMKTARRLPCLHSIP